MSPRVLYHIPSPRPARPECDAVVQEIEALRAKNGGETLYVHPSEYTRVPLPRVLFGMWNLRELRTREAAVAVHHIYNPDLYPYPYLRFLQKPIVYSVAAGFASHRRIPIAYFSNVIARTVVSDVDSERRLRTAGLRNVCLAPPGVSLSRFRFVPNEPSDTLVLLVGSAPWTRKQFDVKGVDALLDVAARLPSLRLVFLWRGHLLSELVARVQRLGLQARVEIIDEVVNVDQVLARVHAAVVLVKDAAVVKAYPHSLLEALAAGRPVLISRQLPLAAWVEREQCGVVIDRVEPERIVAALAHLRAEYRNMQSRARRAGQAAFPIEATLSAYRGVYDELVSEGRADA